MGTSVNGSGRIKRDIKPRLLDDPAPRPARANQGTAANRITKRPGIPDERPGRPNTRAGASTKSPDTDPPPPPGCSNRSGGRGTSWCS